MNVCGIDYSARAVDVVLLDEETHDATWHRFELADGQDAFERSRSVRASMPSRSWWEDHGVIAAGIEQPRGHGAGHLYRIQGAILQCLPAQLLVQPMIPSQWRLTVGLKGNCGKSDIAAWAQAMGCPEAWPQDACDAYGIAHATRGLLHRSEAA